MSKGPLSAILKEHTEERAARAARLDGHVNAAVGLAAAVENDARACLGLEVHSVVSNHQVLDGAIKKIQKQCADLSAEAHAHGAQHAALVSSLVEIGSLALWLKQSEAALKVVDGHLEFIGKRLASED